ncbi:hypothetical protein AZE42_13657 [Rhizopogon vesiculosus]|uniref:Uncharacterized protein n=1 Tax=Rhizopogon vesiculosus TaxID=180088 RepID=A0A1J8Q1E5_9AGAM|nr:hypothetical protein AZE42_13657 [Rhizopogon vesiculosus]
MSFFIAMKESYIWVGLYAIIANGFEFKFLASIVSISQLIEDVNSRCCRLNGRLVLRDMASEGSRMQTLNNASEGPRTSQSVVINDTRTVEISPQKYDGFDAMEC